MFCCGCLNTEAKLRILNKNLKDDIREFLGLKVLNKYLYKYICSTCYVTLKKAIKFKEQCMEARSMFVSMVNISRKSLNTLHTLNFKPNLTQGKAVLINVGPALETNEDSSFSLIQNIKSEVPDEGTFMDVNETSFDVKVHFNEDNALSNEDVVKSNEVYIEVDEIVPETVLFVTDKESNDGIVVKEEPKESEDDTTYNPNSVFGDPVNIEIEISDPNLNKAGVSSPQSYTNTFKNDKSFEIDNLADGKSDTSDNLSNAGSGNFSDDSNVFSDNSADIDDNGISSNSEDDKEFSRQIDEIIKTGGKKKKPFDMSKFTVAEMNLLRRMNLLKQTEKRSRKTKFKKKAKCNMTNADDNSEDTQSDTQNELNVKAESGLNIKKEDENNTDDELKIKRNVKRRTKLIKSRGIECFCRKYNTSYTVMSEEERVDDMMQKRMSKRYTEAKYKCDGCYKVFPSESNLKKHLDELHDPNKRFACKYCAKRFSNNKLQKVHVTRNHTYKITCNVCGLVSKDKNHMACHYSMHTNRVDKCVYCEQVFDRVKNYRIHLRVAHAQKLDCCRFCGRLYLLLERHIQQKHSKFLNLPPSLKCSSCEVHYVNQKAFDAHKQLCEKGDWCVHCGIRYEDGEALRKHLLEHYGSNDPRVPPNFQTPKRRVRDANAINKGYKRTDKMMCDICGKLVFVTYMKYHILFAHTEERPFKCTTCTKCFKTKMALELHTRVHTGERPYTCNICEKAFKATGALCRHMLVHTGRRPYSCPVCHKTYQTSTIVKMHIKTVHQKAVLPPRKRKRMKVAEGE